MGCFVFLQISRLVKVMKAVYGDAQCNASKQPIGSCLQRNQRLSRFHFKGRMNVAIILRSMRDPMMVKRSLRTFEIMTWVSC